MVVVSGSSESKSGMGNGEVFAKFSAVAGRYRLAGRFHKILFAGRPPVARRIFKKYQCLPVIRLYESKSGQNFAKFQKFGPFLSKNVSFEPFGYKIGQNMITRDSEIKRM